MKKGNERRYLMKYCFTQKYDSLGIFYFGKREEIRTAQHTFDAEDDEDAIIKAKENLVAIRKVSIKNGDKTSNFRIVSLFELRDITDLFKNTPIHE